MGKGARPSIRNSERVNVRPRFPTRPRFRPQGLKARPIFSPLPAPPNTPGNTRIYPNFPLGFHARLTCLSGPSTRPGHRAPTTAPAPASSSRPSISDLRTSISDPASIRAHSCSFVVKNFGPSLYSALLRSSLIRSDRVRFAPIFDLRPRLFHPCSCPSLNLRSPISELRSPTPPAPRSASSAPSRLLCVKTLRSYHLRVFALAPPPFCNLGRTACHSFPLSALCGPRSGSALCSLPKIAPSRHRPSQSPPDLRSPTPPAP